MRYSLKPMRTSLVNGCSAGIGRAITNRLRADGYRVVGVQRRGLGIRADLRDHRVIPKVWQSVLDELGCAPQLVVLNAGRCISGWLTDLSVDDCVSMIELNLLSPLLFAREVLRTWVDQEMPGHLVFIGLQTALPGASSTPIRRWMRPREVAEAVMFLEAGGAMSGAIINVSGGSSAH
jgi:NAD(P)-dependent dehydrogenase (short-subunit alcohol dehydrogenase family)